MTFITVTPYLSDCQFVSAQSYLDDFRTRALASAKIQEVESAVGLAFSSVLDAEKVGANVTDLLTQINTAGGILAQAENSYRTGNFNEAAAKADSIILIIYQVTGNAQNAKKTATVSSENTFWCNIALILMGAFVFVFSLFMVWRHFRQNYIRGLSEAKPEVTENESQ